MPKRFAKVNTKCREILLLSFVLSFFFQTCKNSNAAFLFAHLLICVSVNHAKCCRSERMFFLSSFLLILSFFFQTHKKKTCKFIYFKLHVSQVFSFWQKKHNVKSVLNFNNYYNLRSGMKAAPALLSQKFNLVFFPGQWHMNLYLWCYIVAWTECNNRLIYYYNNLHNSEFMDIFGRLTSLKATAMNLDYFTDLLAIKHILESLSLDGKSKFWCLCYLVSNKLFIETLY